MCTGEKGQLFLLFFPLSSLLSYFFVCCLDVTAHPILIMTETTIRESAMGFTTPILFDHFHGYSLVILSPNKTIKNCNATFTAMEAILSFQPVTISDTLGENKRRRKNSTP